MIIDGLCQLALRSFARFNSDRAFSDWVSAFHADRVAAHLSKFEIKLVAARDWDFGWRALNELNQSLGGIRSEYDHQLRAEEVRAFMAEIQEQCSLFSEAPLRVLQRNPVKNHGR